MKDFDPPGLKVRPGPCALGPERYCAWPRCACKVSRPSTCPVRLSIPDVACDWPSCGCKEDKPVTEFKDVMIDIETASASTHNAVVLSAAWVPFVIDPKHAEPIMGDRYLVIPSIREQLAAGREVDSNTMQWWLKQSLAASRHWSRPGNGMVQPIITLLDSLRTQTAGKRVWAHGVCFDIGNLESLYRAAGQETPWKFNDVRDSRTIQRLMPPYLTVPDLETVAHDPVADCVRQIWDLRVRWPDSPAE